MIETLRVHVAQCGADSAQDQVRLRDIQRAGLPPEEFVQRQTAPLFHDEKGTIAALFKAKAGHDMRMPQLAQRRYLLAKELQKMAIGGQLAAQ